MTDKKQIIIDGVDITGCVNCLRFCMTTKKPEAICKIYEYCSKKPDCYYKQLARKKQECKKLNDKIIDMNSIIEDAAINLGNKDFTLYDLPFEIKKLRKECDIWKNQVLILDEEDVTVEVTQEQFEEY